MKRFHSIGPNPLSRDGFGIYHEGDSVDNLIELITTSNEKTIRNLCDKYEIYRSSAGCSLAFLGDAPLDKILEVGKNQQITQLSFVALDVSQHQKLMTVLALNKTICVNLSFNSPSTFFQETEGLTFPNVIEATLLNFLSESEVNEFRRVFPGLSLLEYRDKSIGNEVVVHFD